MANLVVFCDGTWNDMTLEETTHVDELYKATLTDSDQVSVYFPGVGTDGNFLTTVGQTVNKYGGGAFGWGLNQRIKEAYAWLAARYRPGDRIYLFGFSRGAYTARSLAGMIRKSGFPDRVTRGSVNRAFRLYKQPGEYNAPDERHIQEARRRMSPHFATSQADLSWRGDASALIQIAYLGVWDTVGALGIPERLTGPLNSVINFRHQFHDTELSSKIEAARHAVSLDERRAFYPPALWTNLNRLSTGVGQGASDIRPDRRYQQMWFVGDHGTLGGSAEGETLNQISAVTLAWIRDGAVDAGMRLLPDVAVPDARPDVTAGQDVRSKPDVEDSTPARFLAWRDGPERGFEVHPSVDERLADDPAYRPKSLSTVRPHLFGP